MRRVLCISPHFPPVNLPDVHRLRQTLPHLSDFGWEPVVFTVDSADVEGPKDPLLLQSVPDDVKVHRVSAFSSRLTRKVGLGNVGFRSLLQLRAAVDAYLAMHRADLIYFPTTVFTSMSLGPHWRTKFGVPFVVDLQDPWRNDYHLTLPRDQRPKKFWFDYWQKKTLEARTLPHASGLTAVSQHYIDEVMARYPTIVGRPAMELTFGFDPADHDIVERNAVANSVFAPDPETFRFVFTGVTPASMETSIRLFMQALGRASARSAKTLKAHFVGTYYHPPADPSAPPSLVRRLAQDNGIDGLVAEEKARKSHFEVLRIIKDADALLILGVQEESYSPSKLAPYLYGGRPIVSVLHEGANIIEPLEAAGRSDYVTFGHGAEDEAVVEALAAVLIRVAAGKGSTAKPPGEFLAVHSSREKTRRLCALFDQVIDVEPLC